MRRPYIHLAGDLSGWPFGTTPTPTLLRNFDQYSSELVNGEEGGSYAPADPIVLGPVGVAATWTLGSSGSLLSGNVETVRGNGRFNDTTPTGLVTQGGSSPVFENPRTRSVIVPTTVFTESNPNIASTPGIGSGGGVQTANVGNYCFDVDPVTQACRVASQGFNGTSIAIASVVVPIRAQHRNATISSIDFRYRVYANYSTYFPWVRSSTGIRVMRFRALLVGANTILPLHTPGADLYTSAYDSNGWVCDPATSWPQYYAGGNTKTLSFLPDQNNVAIDTGSFALVLQWQGDQYLPSIGPFVWNGSLWLNSVVNLSSIVDIRPE